MKRTNILVGVNGSEEAVEATKWAAALAQKTNARLSILCAYSLASYSAAALDGGFAVVDDEALKQGAIEAAREAELAVGDYDIEVETLVRLGDPGTVLTEMSSEYDTIVIGSHGGGGFADRFLGAVSASLPAHAKCPVVVVPTHQSGKAFLPVERIVVGVDGSDVASAALCQAVDLAEVWGASLTAVVAVPIATGGGAMSWLPLAVDRQALMEDIRRGLDMAISQAVAGRDIEVARHALDGSPSALLTEFSTAVDMVVVGTRGRGGFAGMLLGSTSQAVLQHSTCPVMTVPSKHRDRRSNPATKWERR